MAVSWNDAGYCALLKRDPHGRLALLPKATQLHTLEILYHILRGYRGDKREKILKFLQILRTIDQEYRNMLYFKDYTSWAATGVGICGKAKRNYAEATRLSILRSRLLRRTGALGATPRVKGEL